MMTDAVQRPLRLARISTVPFFVTTQLLAQLQHLASAGLDVTVVCSDGLEAPVLRARPELNFVPIEIPRSLSPWRDLVALWRLLVLFRRQRFDIVHSTTPKAGLLCAVAAALARIPVRLHTFTGQPWVTRGGALSWFARLSDALICRLNTCCYADSAGQRDFLIRQGIVTSDRISVLGQGSLAGVNSQRFDPGRWTSAQRRDLRQGLGIDGNSKVVIFVGRITVDKGIRELLAAFSAVLAQGDDAVLLLVGPLDDEHGTDTGLSARSLAAHPRVVATGFVPDPERFLAIADLLCLPSYREGFGTVVLEAAAMGVPAIGTRIYGLSDAIVDGQTGRLVPVRDVDALTQQLQSLLRDDAGRRDMGAHARQRCLRDFSIEAMSGLLLHDYRTLLAAQREAKA